MSTPGPQNSNGSGVNIGFPGGLTPTGINWFFQDASQSSESENYMVHDEIGNMTISAWFNNFQVFKLSGIIKGAGQAAAQAATSLTGIPPGTLLTVATCAALPDIVSTSLEVMSAPEVTGNNKDAKKLTITVRKSPGITVTMPA